MTPTTADEMAFIQAIIAAPLDDAPRLVFADWLDENGQPDTAAIIRMQVRFKDHESGAYGLSTRFCESNNPEAVQAAISWRLGFASLFVCTKAFFVEHFDTMDAHHPIASIMIIPSRGEYRRDGYWYESDDKFRDSIERCQWRITVSRIQGVFVPASYASPSSPAVNPEPMQVDPYIRGVFGPDGIRVAGLIFDRISELTSGVSIPATWVRDQLGLPPAEEGEVDG